MLQHVSSRVAGFFGAVAVSVGEAAKPSSSKVSKQAVMWQAWHFVTFHHLSRHVKRGFVWQVQYFCDVFRRCAAFFVVGAALWRLPMSFCLARAPLSTCRVACLLRIAISGLRDVVTLTTLHFALHTLHSTLHTLDPTSSIPHFTLDTLHSTHATLHSTLHTFHFTLHTSHLHLTLRTSHFTPRT